jgi:hypothetical protein
VAEQAATQLALINTAAAAEGNLLRLFACQESFPEVFERHAELEAARRLLDAQLPGLAKTLGVPKLTYTSIQNQVPLLAAVGPVWTLGSKTMSLGWCLAGAHSWPKQHGEGHIRL